MTLRPGDLVYVDNVATPYPKEGLFRTMSTYGYESHPRRNDLYLVCKDMSLKSYHEPGRLIGWSLEETPTGWFTRLQLERTRAVVRYHSHIDVGPGPSQDAQWLSDADSVESVTSGSY